MLAMSGNCAEALRQYNSILERFQEAPIPANDSVARNRAEAVILYKMSKVHRKQNDIEAEVNKLELALRVVREIVATTEKEAEQRERLETQILSDISKGRKELDSIDLEWV
jgi:predicted regulator of amino acid metabolism with ACT domain